MACCNRIDQRQILACAFDDGLIPTCRAHIRFLNTVNNLPAVANPLLRGFPANVFVDRNLTVRTLPYNVATEFLPISADFHLITFSFIGTATILTLNVSLTLGRYYTLVAQGDFSNNPVLRLYEDNLKCGKKKCSGRLEFINAVSNSPNVDLYLDDTRVFSDIAYSSNTVGRCINAGSYPLRIIPTGTANTSNKDNIFAGVTVLVGPIDVDLYENYVYTIIMTGSTTTTVGFLVLSVPCCNRRVIKCITDPCFQTCQQRQKIKRCNKGSCRRCDNCDCWEVPESTCGGCPRGCRPIFSSEAFATAIDPRLFTQRDF